MASSTRLTVMLSSRCTDGFPKSIKEGGVSLTDIRRQLKADIEVFKLFERQLFEVWINEDAPPADASRDSWEKCLQQVDNCDILIVLANGNAGWAPPDGGGIGICHAEYMQGLNSARGKVFRIALPDIEPPRDKTQLALNEKFQEYVTQQAAFRGGEVRTLDDLKERVKDVLSEAVITLAQKGVFSESGSRFDLGQALDWARLDYRSRKSAMESVLRSSLGIRGKELAEGLYGVELAKTQVGFVVHAIPAAMSIATAREMVGRPFLSDHTRIDDLKNAAGPVHLIACHRSATEAQAIAMLGFPDATVVNTAFGIYVADDVQKVQFVFLKNCRDESNLKHAQQRFFDWLAQSGEGSLLAKRASSRKKIISAIAKEFKS